MAASDKTVHRLLEVAGRTYAQEAGIRLKDTPASLYQLLVLATLLSARINAKIAVAAAAELRRGGFTTPQRMRDASWQEIVDALGRAHYRRYDESTATALRDGAQLLIDRYHGDLRQLRGKNDMCRRLREIPRIGPAGVDIFCREVQAIWPELRPYFDGKALDSAKRVGLPMDPGKLADLVGDDQVADLAAALVRATIDKDVREELAA
ncbi:endonuclease [Fodinicola acaciae]|uniref:endonuclease n=1 Tax=Fodinicola acaciae TaxID=2681555 RepID=UPI0013D881F5|nr:endonuclease [Fodinicola acaciae]